MRKIIQEKNFLVFRDLDGILSFSIKAFDGCPHDPLFLFDDKKQAFLLRRPGQTILLDDLSDEFAKLLHHASLVRLLETPEDSSEIIRQYEIPVTKIETIRVDSARMAAEDSSFPDYLPHSA